MEINGHEEVTGEEIDHACDTKQELTAKQEDHVLEEARERTANALLGGNCGGHHFSPEEIEAQKGAKERVEALNNDK